MKQILLLIFFVLSFSAVTRAQVVETFDVATFRVPAGWNRQAGADAVQLSIDDKASAFALITVYRSIAGLPGAKENFDLSWEAIVKDAVRVTDAPQMIPEENKDGWQLVGGTAPFEKDGLKGVAVLMTLSDGGEMLNVLVLTSSGAYEAAISSFLESIKLKKARNLPGTGGAKTCPATGRHRRTFGNFALLETNPESN